MFSYSGGGVLSANGSSVTDGGCSGNIYGVTCSRPTSSILFDGNVPTLTGLDGDMWASQLLTIEVAGYNIVEFTFNFTDTPGYTGFMRAEVVIFNCPEWGISLRTITLMATSRTRNTQTSISTSCDSLVRVQLPSAVSSSQQIVTLQFDPYCTSTWVHLAEITFFTDVFTSSPTVQETTNTLDSKHNK